eukprot:TRINITY_DN4658_c0_g1_i4.p1 TRINITY_DN4658_c0_g1~~TRINITY_DN4658_c0_g1_i4.p1  ORF type:complete len:190 (-),score=42.45 TRINITY_DN4658_c0_g1_i4:378-947(-)
MWLRKLLGRVSGPPKKHVGNDLAGNKYFSMPLAPEGESALTKIEQEVRDMEEKDEHSPERLHETEKRWVEFVSSVHDPTQVPVQWQSWLKYRRFDPPSTTELLRFEHEQRNLAHRVRELAQEDEKTRIQQASRSRRGEDEDANSFDAFLSGINNAGNSSAPPPPPPSDGLSDASKREEWNPNAEPHSDR